MNGPGRFPLPLLFFAAALFLFRVLSQLDLDEDILEDLPFLSAVAAFVLFRVFSSRTETKRRGPVPRPMPVPMPAPEPTAEPQPKDLGFKIPPLKGAPKDAQAEAQEARNADEELDVLRRESYERHMAEKQAREEKKEQERLRREHREREMQTAKPETLSFSPDALRNAVIWSEVLGKPKALRKQER